MFAAIAGVLASRTAVQGASVPVRFGVTQTSFSSEVVKDLAANFGVTQTSFSSEVVKDALISFGVTQTSFSSEVVKDLTVGFGVSQTAFTAPNEASFPVKLAGPTNLSLGLHFNDETGFQDVSSYNHQVAQNIGPVLVNNAEAKYGSGSALFRSINASYITFDHPVFNLAKQNFTLQFWFKTPNFSTIQLLASTRPISGPDYGFQLFLVPGTGGGLRFFAYDVNSSLFADMGSTGTFTPNIWYHVAVVREEQRFSLYCSAFGSRITRVVTPATGDTIGPSQLLTLGRDPQVSGREFNGRMDEFSLHVGQALYSGDDHVPPAFEFSP